MTLKTLDYTLLAARIEDILDIERKVFDAVGELYDKRPWGRSQFLAERKGKETLSCVVSEGESTSGFSIAYEFDAGYAHISRFAVAPERASKGFGSALLDFQMKVAAGQKYRRCSVDLIAKNSNARKLYESRGFTKLNGQALKDYVQLKGRAEEEYLGDAPSHIAMMRPL